MFSPVHCPPMEYLYFGSISPPSVKEVLVRARGRSGAAVGTEVAALPHALNKMDAMMMINDAMVKRFILFPLWIKIIYCPLVTLSYINVIGQLNWNSIAWQSR